MAPGPGQSAWEWSCALPAPNAHLVCLTDWLGNRNIRVFLDRLSEGLWPDAARNLALLGVLCLRHLTDNPEFLWAPGDLAELVDYIQREQRWPKDL
eukprot:CAMPEP_0179312032 /NCGR_PEP_ID=MMETSP0797-20121207/53021_1 /TAXON_ID=47934 /ORGANISM="Dinophysis acuminata, Strain DAEP01" /LENGTH=95 /DNA_ID=CAMNT_0021021881 /DNA_START=55 /DNA_END=339 /DNA_ORIENTATION=-